MSLIGLLGAALTLPGAALALPPGLVAAYDFTRTNFANHSEDLTQTSWGRANANVSTVQTVLADGALGNVTKLADNTNNSQHLIFPANVPVADNAPESFVWRVKAAEYRYVGVQWANKAFTGYPTVIVDLQDGVVLNLQGAPAGTSLSLSSAGTTTAVSITPVGNGWYDVAVSVPSVGAGSNSPRPALLLQNQATNSNSFTFAGTGTSGVLIHRMQWNLTLNPLPYERTTDGQTVVDRSVRLGSLPTPRFNHLLWTEDFTQSAWTKAGLTPSDPAQTDPLTGAKATRMTVTTGDPYLTQIVQGNPSGLTVTYTARVKMEGAIAGRQFRFYSYGTSSTEALAQSNPIAATGDWQTVSFTRTFPAGMTSTSHFWRIDLPENGQVVGDTVLIAAPTLNAGAVALPYQKQTHGIVQDDSLRGVNMVYSPDGHGSGNTTPVLPAGWRYGSDTNVAQSVTAIRPNASVPGTYELDITATNNDTVNRVFRLYITPSATAPDAVVVNPGDLMTLSAGLASNVTGTVSLNVYAYTAGKVFLGNAFYAPVVTGGAPLTRFGAARPMMADAACTYALGVIEFGLLPGTSRTVTVHAPCFARGDVGTGYIRPPTHATLGSSATAADSNDPTWGLTGLNFGGDDYASAPCPHADQMSWFVVAQQDVVPSNANGNLVGLLALDVSGSGPVTNPPFVVQMTVDLNVQCAICTVASNPPTGDGQIGTAVITSNPTTLGKPFGVGGTFDGQSLKAFYGGRVRSTAVRPGVLANTVGALRIGQQKITTNRYQTGATYLVLVWNRALLDREMGQVDRAAREYLGRRGVTYDRS